jgi:V/A-type H+-transporting ATPase subunit D
MARLNVPPTKSNQLNLKRDLSMATEGHTLLEQKREILVLELMHLLDSARRLETELATRQKQAYASLRRSLARNGQRVLDDLASGIQDSHAVTHETKVMAGIRTPSVQVKLGERRLQYGFAATDSTVDQVRRDFLGLLELTGRLAELETTIWLLARELKKTQRRVNALEHIFIPNYQDTLHYITESLESKELDSFFSMKIIKKKLND